MDKTLKIGRTVHYCADIEVDCVPATIQRVIDADEKIVEVVWLKKIEARVDTHMYRDESKPRFVEAGYGSEGWHWFDECPRGL